MSGKPLLILGAGSFALETLNIAETSGGFEPLGFVNNVERPAPGAAHAALPVFWFEDLPFGPAECWLVAGMVSTRRRDFVESMARLPVHVGGASVRYVWKFGPLSQCL